MNDLEMAAKFREAADVIREKGLAKGAFYLPTGHRCAYGALAPTLAPKPFEDCHTWNGGIGFRIPALIQPLVFPYIGEALHSWNDDLARTPADVIALFETVAHDLELRHQITITTPVDTTVPTTEQIAQPSPSLLKEAVPVG